MSDIQIFTNPDFGDVRVIDLDGDAWLVGKDVAQALGYTRTADAIREHVPDKFKGVAEIPTPGGKQQVVVINEAGLYKLVMRSKLPAAEKFSDWVCACVLPNIRKHGFYATPQKIEDIVRNPDLFIEQLMTAYKRVKAERDALKPKADYCNEVLQSDELFLATTIAKTYGLAGQEFNKLLEEHQIQFRRNQQWHLFAKYDDLGYVFYDTRIIAGKIRTTMKWTHKGRNFLYHFLKQRGITPLVEQASQCTLF